MKIWVLVQKDNRTSGHGQSVEEAVLAQEEVYSTEHPCPAFRSLADAQDYIEKHRRFWLAPYELELREEA